MSGLGQNIHLLHSAAAAAILAAERRLADWEAGTPLRGRWCLSVGRQPRDPRGGGVEDEAQRELVGAVAVVVVI